ncbi:hypothetical protein GOODEAATRI_026555 [Goodea atripinnis]|uniref:Uncharacterized protein n=1 Tax=Goodea atripinnis TaxID=208336 RepID=A0ABV0MVC8_9TELE
MLLDHLFAEYWTICTLLDATMLFSIIGHFVPQDSLLLQIPAGTAADRTGRRSSDVTVGYITYSETAPIAFQLGTEMRLPRDWSVILEKKLTRGLSFILPLVRKLSELSLQE